MSKSYKKFPVVRQEKIDKKESNRRLRNLDIDYCLKGNQYKKIACVGWNWSYPWTLEEAIAMYETDERIQRMHPTKEDYINYWKRCCYRK